MGRICVTINTLPANDSVHWLSQDPSPPPSSRSTEGDRGHPSPLGFDVSTGGQRELRSGVAPFGPCHWGGQTWPSAASPPAV